TLIACGPARVDLNVGSDGPSQLLQPLQKRRVAGLHLRIARGPGHERAHAPHLFALLRAHRERPGCCAADERYELAPLPVKHGAPSLQAGATNWLGHDNTARRGRAAALRDFDLA